jgi:hypothetical protein
MASKIPLRCNICPKRPKFSDVSHLLTHIASKGHLSNYYKVKVRASGDPVSRSLIEEYDQWYAEWNVEDLMSERMSLKDKKKGRKTLGKFNLFARPPLTTSGSGHTSTSASPLANTLRSNSGVCGRGTSHASTLHSYQHSPAASVLDPRLEHAIKQEQDVTPHLPSMTLPPFEDQPYENRSNETRNFEARNFENRSHHSLASSYHLQYQPLEQPYYIPRNDAYGHTAHPEPPAFHYGEPSRHNHYADPITISSNSRADPVTPPGYSDGDNDLPMPEESKDIAKLKGVYWPGMSIFDSATPMAKRRRNQRKDASIVEQLESNSLDVEATESIWTPNGSLMKQKFITGLPSSSSPIMSPVQAPWRPPLSQIPHRQDWAAPAVSGGRSSYSDSKLEQELNYGMSTRAGRKKKRAFEIFQEDEPEHTDQIIGGQQQLSHLTREYVSRENQDALIPKNRSRMLGLATFGDRKPSFGVADHTLKSDDGQRRRDTMIHNPKLTLPVIPGDEPVSRLTSDPVGYRRSSSNFNAFDTNGIFGQGTTASRTRGVERRHTHSLSIEALCNMATSQAFQDHSPEHTSGPTFPFLSAAQQYHQLNFQQQPSLEWLTFLNSVQNAHASPFWGFSADEPHMDNLPTAAAHMDASPYPDDDLPSVGEPPATAGMRTQANGMQANASNVEAEQGIAPSKLGRSPRSLDTDLDDGRTISMPASPRGRH